MQKSEETEKGKDADDQLTGYTSEHCNFDKCQGLKRKFIRFPLLSSAWIYFQENPLLEPKKQPVGDTKMHRVMESKTEKNQKWRTAKPPLIQDSYAWDEFK